MKQNYKLWIEICNTLQEIKTSLALTLNSELGPQAAYAYFFAYVPELAQAELSNVSITDFISDAYPILEYAADGNPIDNRKPANINAVVAFNANYENSEQTVRNGLSAVYVAIGVIGAINSAINMFQRTAKLYNDELAFDVEFDNVTEDALLNMQVTCWDYLHEAFIILAKYDSIEIRVLCKKFLPYLEANQAMRKAFVKSKVEYFSNQFDERTMGGLVVGGEKLLQLVYGDGVNLHPPECKLYLESKLYKLREEFQHSWLVAGFTSILNFTSILKAFKRAVDPNIEHSMYRKNYLTAIASIVWALYVKALANKKNNNGKIKDIKIIDPESRIYTFLSGYQELTGIWSDFTFPLDGGFGINMRFKGGDYALPALPNQMSRLIIKQSIINGYNCVNINLSDALAISFAEIYETANSYIYDDTVEAWNGAGKLEVMYLCFCLNMNISTSEDRLPVHQMWKIMDIDIGDNYIAGNNRQEFLNTLKICGYEQKYLMVREYGEIIVDMSEYPALYNSSEFSENDILSIAEYSAAKRNTEPQRFGLAVLKSAYHLLVDATSDLCLKNVTPAESFSGNDVWVQLFSCKTTDCKIVLFEPVVLKASDNPDTKLLSEALEFYVANIHNLQSANIKRIVVPIGEVNYNPMLSYKRSHLVTLVIDIALENGEIGYKAHVVDPVGYSILDRNQEITHNLQKYLGYQCMVSNREMLGHEGFFDTLSCGYFTLKIISFLLDNHQINKISLNIPKPDSWFGTSYNWLSEKQTLQIFSGAMQSYCKYRSNTLMESYMLKDTAVRKIQQAYTKRSKHLALKKFSNDSL